MSKKGNRPILDSFLSGVIMAYFGQDIVSPDVRLGFYFVGAGVLTVFNAILFWNYDGE